MTVTTIDIPDVNAVTRTVSTMDALLNTEDAASTADPVGPMLIGVRRDTLSASEVSADGDNIAIKADSRGALHVAVAATAKSIAKAEDVASADADVGVPAMAIQLATPTDTAGTDADYAMMQMSGGRLWVSSPPAAATSIGKAEDVASADADVGVPAMAVRKATPANTSGTDGDYEMLQISAGRLWTSTTVPAAATSIGKAEDVASADADVGVPAMAIQLITPTDTAGTDGDYAMLQMKNGRLWASSLVTAAATSIGKAEDVASADADVGVPAMAVQLITPTDTAGTDGDYAMLQMKNGRLWGSSIVTAEATSIGKAEDVASADADVGVPAMAVRKATPVNTSGTDGDYEMLEVSNGRLWVSGGINIVQAASATITRPGDTTAYTSGDLVANSTTAGSVNALQFITLARVSGGGGEITGVTIQKSTNVVTSVALRVHLFTTIPTFVTNGDNTAISTVVVALAKGYLGYVDVSTFVAFSDVAWGSGAPDNSRGSIAFAATAQIIYGIVEARGAFTPGNAEVFTVSLAARQN